MMRSNPGSALQKTYDDCHLLCCTAVYFESQGDENEALRCWRNALEQINYHHAFRTPPDFRPTSETERALHKSLGRLELQCKERIDLLEALRDSRNESTPGSSDRGITPGQPERQQGWLGDGTIPAMDYNELLQMAPLSATSSSTSQPPLPPRNALRSRTGDPTKRSSPSPDKTPRMRDTLRSRVRQEPLTPTTSATSTAGESSRRPPIAAKAATRAWTKTATLQEDPMALEADGQLSTLSNLKINSETDVLRVPKTRKQQQRFPSMDETSLPRATTPTETPPRVSRKALNTIAKTVQRSDSKTATTKSVKPQEEDSPQSDVLSQLPPAIDRHCASQVLNEIIVQGDEVHWTDISGLEGAKQALKESVVYPFLRPDLFKGLREPAKGILLFGPPGTGKTMLARAVATESKSTFFAISASSLTSKYLGESEKLVRALFGLAKVLAPSIIFVDEIDSLLSKRDGNTEHESSRRIKTEFLIQWSDLARAAAGREAVDQNTGDASRVLVLAATNSPWAIDEAARRRFVRRCYIPLPEAPVRESQIRSLLVHQKHALQDSDLAELAKLTESKLHVWTPAFRFPS
jgi:SpoVK/Ycf46/Vps4 family AAA+-type ATPase